MRLALVLALAVTPLFAAPAFADCAADIKTVLKSAITSGPYRIETSITGSSGDVAMTAEVIPPGAMHSVTVTGGQTIEMTFLDGKGWMNMAGTWSELPPEMAGQMTVMFDPAVIDAMGELTDAKCLGSTSFGGRDLLTFDYGFGMSGMTSTNTLYVDPTTNLPVRMESTSKMDAAETETMVTYEYDPSVTVVAPM